jgi:hypothetical protein
MHAIVAPAPSPISGTLARNHPTCAATAFCGDCGAAAAAATAELMPAARATCCCWMSPTSRLSAPRARSSHCVGGWVVESENSSSWAPRLSRVQKIQRMRRCKQCRLPT